jgi:hypothetical protein
VPIIQVSTSGFDVKLDKRQSNPDARPLPANRAFVVQFQAVNAKDKNVFQGRIEHLASGRAEHFGDVTELRSIISELLSFEPL